jgi:uncharacterized membrane-anchored protein
MKTMETKRKEALERRKLDLKSYRTQLETAGSDDAKDALRVRIQRAEECIAATTKKLQHY